MNNEKSLTVITGTEIKAVKGLAEFTNYDEVEKRISEIKLYLSQIEVTEETLSEAKKLASKIRKEVDRLNRERIDRKKEYLEPFDKVEKQVKRISSLATEAENIIRTQTRAFDELQRDQKEEKLKIIFEKRKRHYDYNDLFKFEDYLEQKYLNKTFSIDQAERKMVEWLEERKNDLKVFEVQSQDDEELAKFIKIYFDEGSLMFSKTILIKNAKDEESKKIFTSISKNPPPPQRKKQEERKVSITIMESDLEKITTLLDTLEIKYQIQKH